MTPDLPTWTEFDPGALAPLAGGSAAGRVVALVAGPGAMGAGWAAQVALELASVWGKRVVLADAGIETPSLHHAVDIPVDEGLSDLLLWGASVKRVMRPLPQGGFFVTAGTPVAHGAELLGEERWLTFCDGFRQAGVTLAVLVPASESGLDAVVEVSDDVILIAAPDEDPELLIASGAEKVRATVGRTVPVGADEGPAADEEVPGPREDPAEQAGESVGAFGAFPVGEFTPPPPVRELDAPVEEELETPADQDLRAPGDEEVEERPSGSSDEAPEEPGEADSEERDTGPEPLHEDLLMAPPTPPVPAPRPRVWTDPLIGDASARDEDTFPAGAADALDQGPSAPSLEEIVEDAAAGAAPRAGGRRTLLLVLLVVVLAAVATAAYLGYLNVPGVTRSSAAVSTPPAPAPVAVAPAVESSPLQAYSVALGAYQDETVAANTAAAMAGKVPGVLFITAPVDVNGAIFLRVLAGPAEDSASAAALAARVASESKSDGSMWVPRSTPRAFQLGEMAELDAARRRADVLMGLGIPAYVFAVDFDDGSVRYRVYAGAYADEAEASYLSSLLQERGLNTATLSDRIGRLPE